MNKAEIKTEQNVYYRTLWEAHYIAPTYLKELLKGAKEQHRNLIEYDDIDNLGIVYILANGDRFVITQITDKKHPENSHNTCAYLKRE